MIEVTETKTLFNKFIIVIFTANDTKQTLLANVNKDKAIVRLNKERLKYSEKFLNGTLSIKNWQEINRDIDARIEKEQKRVLSNDAEMTIDTRNFSIQPAIDFSSKIVPGNFCYDMSLKINNLVLRKGLTPQDITHIRVILGYESLTTGKTPIVRTFDMSVMFAHQERPLPNSVTVFSGLSLAPTLSGILEESIQTYKVGDLIKSINQKIKSNTSAEQNNNLFVSLIKTVGQVILQGAGIYTGIVLEVLGCAALTVPVGYLTAWEKLTFSGKTHYDIFRKYIEWVNEVVGKINGTHKYVARLDIEGNAFKVIVSGDKEYTKNLTQIPYLTQVRNASLLASVLTVEALFDPRITPGSLFYMPLHFYAASRSLSSLSKPAGLFRVLTIETEFGTTSKNNRMVLKGIEVTPIELATLSNETLPSITPKDTSLTLTYSSSSASTSPQYWSYSLTRSDVFTTVIASKWDSLKKIAERKWGKNPLVTAEQLGILAGQYQVDIPLCNIYPCDFAFLIPLYTYLYGSSTGVTIAYAEGSPDASVIAMMNDFTYLVRGYCVCLPPSLSLSVDKTTILAILPLLPALYKNAGEQQEKWDAIKAYLTYGGL